MDFVPLAAVVAVFAAALLAVAVGRAGGWRRVKPGSVSVLSSGPVAGLASGPVSVSPSIPGPLAALGWRLRVMTQVLRALTLAAFGLTPLGAWFVRLVAPGGTHWRVTAAVLVIVAIAWVVPRPPAWWWLRLVRASRPTLVRPRQPWRLRLVLPAILACLLAVVLSAFAGLTGFHSNEMLIVELASLALSILLRRVYEAAERAGMSCSPRLVTALESLPARPDGMPVTVAAGWRRPVVNAAAVPGLRRERIVVAPPLVDALTDRQLRTVVAHERAHLQNHDLWWRILRLLLIALASATVAIALYGVPALRQLAGLRGIARHGDLTGQSVPLLLALAYLAAKVLRAADLRACRAEETAADLRAVELTGDRAASLEADSALASMVGTPESWSLPQRLLIATHPARGERLRMLLRDGPAVDAVDAVDAVKRRRRRGAAGPAGVTASWVGSHRRKVAALAVVGVVVVTFALLFAHDYAAEGRPPSNAGSYQVVPPARFESASLSAATWSRSALWRDGIKIFPGATPVGAVYDQVGGFTYYVWGADGKLDDPTGELSALWKATNPLASLNEPGLYVIADDEPTGPLGGNLQCEQGVNVCAWADYSSIVVVSLWPPGDSATSSSDPNDPSEQQMAALTLSFRGKSEQLRHQTAG